MKNRRLISFFIVSLVFALSSHAQHHSLRFDGTDDYVSLGNNVKFTVSDTFTIQVWVKVEPNQPFQLIISRLDSFYNGWGLSLSSGIPSFSFVNNALSNYVYVSANVQINDSQWHSITVNHFGNGNILFEVDNMFPSMSTVSKGTLYPNVYGENTLIGAVDRNNKPKEFLKGNIDELRIWDTIIGANPSYPLSQELMGNEAHLIAYYKFDHANSTCDVLDYSPSGYHGVRQGSQGSNNLPQYSVDIPVMTPIVPPTVANCGFVGLPKANITELNVYPNPSNGVFNIELNHNELTEVVITNIHGMVVYKDEFFGDHFRMQSELPAGQYHISVTQESGDYFAKIVLQ